MAKTTTKDMMILVNLPIQSTITPANISVRVRIHFSMTVTSLPVPSLSVLLLSSPTNSVSNLFDRYSPHTGRISVWPYFNHNNLATLYAPISIIKSHNLEYASAILPHCTSSMMSLVIETLYTINMEAIIGKIAPRINIPGDSTTGLKNDFINVMNDLLMCSMVIVFYRQLLLE